MFAITRPSLVNSINPNLPFTTICTQVWKIISWFTSIQYLCIYVPMYLCMYVCIYLSIYLYYIYIYIVYIYIYILYIYVYISGHKWSTSHRELKSHKSKMSVIYIHSWKQYALRLSPQWLCANSCTWARYVRLYIYIDVYIYIIYIYIYKYIYIYIYDILCLWHFLFCRWFIST